MNTETRYYVRIRIYEINPSANDFPQTVIEN